MSEIPNIVDQQNVQGILIAQTVQNNNLILESSQLQQQTNFQQSLNFQQHQASMSAFFQANLGSNSGSSLPRTSSHLRSTFYVSTDSSFFSKFRKNPDLGRFPTQTFDMFQVDRTWPWNLTKNATIQIVVYLHHGYGSAVVYTHLTYFERRGKHFGGDSFRWSSKSK